MKRILLLLTLLLAFTSVKAETYTFISDYFSIKSVNNTKWSDWEECVVTITVSIEYGYITIDSNQPQRFVFTSRDYRNYKSQEGYDIIDIKCVDIEGKRCGIRMTTQTGQYYFYVDYNDITYVYHLNKTY